METVQDGQHCGEVHPRRPHACVPFPYIGPYVREVMSKSNNKKLAILRLRPIDKALDAHTHGRPCCELVIHRSTEPSMCTSSCDEMECKCSLGQPTRLVPVPAQERPLTHPCMHARTDLDPTDIGLNRSIDRAGKLKVLLHGQSTRREEKKIAVA